MEQILSLFNILYIALLILITEGVIKYMNVYFNWDKEPWSQHKTRIKMSVTSAVGILLHSILWYAGGVSIIIPDGLYMFKTAPLFVISSLLSFFFGLYFYDMIMKSILARVKDNFTSKP